MRSAILIFEFMLLIILLTGCATKSSATIHLEDAFPYLSFSNPVDLQTPKDGTNRLFIVEQQGRIIVVQNNRNASTKKIFLDITDRVSWGGEMGLLGLAFHPNYPNNGFFYVNYTATNPRRTVIARFKVSDSNPDSADKNSELILMTFLQPYSNHNGGQLAFGPDGYLYIASGDGGSAGDPQNNSQNIKNLLGKILRIDVNNPQPPLNYGIPPDNPFVDSTNLEIRKEIYAYGLRNPWRFSFDFQTGLLWCADVGQDAWEEIDIIVKGGNYGWRCYEGNAPYNLSGCSGSYIFPIWAYPHSEGQSITGGYVYRGMNIPELYGKYIYGDFVSKKIWALDYSGSGVPTNTFLLTSPQAISSFGVDEQNELYVVGYYGKIYRFQKSTKVHVDKNLSDNSFDLVLKQNYPNPFNAITKLQFHLPTEFQTNLSLQIKIYDEIGREVYSSMINNVNEGMNEVTLNLNELRSGVYFINVMSNKTKKTIKATLIK